MLGHGVSFSGGFQCLSVSDCSIASCDFGALEGKDVRVSFYSANPHLGLKKSTNNKCWRGCGEKEPFYFVVGNVNWCGHYREHWRFLKKLKIELSCDSAFLLLGVYPDKTVQKPQEMWVRSLGQDGPLRRAWQPTPAFLPGESRRQRSLAGYSPWGHKESNKTAAT